MGRSCLESDPWLRSYEYDTEAETAFEEEEEDRNETWTTIVNDDNQTDAGSVTNARGNTKVAKKKKKKNRVLLEGYVETVDDEDDLKRAKSLTDDDLEELKGCLDLGFCFNYEEIPELCNTLPALELCYSMSQKFLDEQQQQQQNKSPESSPVAEPPPATASPIANWKFSSPGDDPDDVKARLKFWARAVACTVKLCS